MTAPKGPLSPEDEQTYIVELADGSQVHIQGPAGATPEQLQAVVAQQQAGASAAPQADAPDPTIGGFPDELPAQPKSKLSPEDEAHYQQLLHTADASTLMQFLASKGASTDPKALATFVDRRDAGNSAGRASAYGVTYDFPSPPETDLPSDLKPGATMSGARGVMSDIPGFSHLAALGRTIDSKLGLDHPTDRSFGDEYNYQSDLGTGTEHGDEENHPWTRVAGQLLGGLALPTGTEGLGLKVGTDVLKAGGTMREARAAVRVAVRTRMAAVNGAYGVAHGAADASTPGEAVTGALTEGALGAATGFGFGSLAREGKAPIKAPTDGQAAVAAFDRQGVDPLAAYVGGTGSQMASGVAHMTLGGIPLSEAAQKTIDQARNARDRIAAGLGWVKDSMGAGRAAQKGSASFLDTTQGRASSLYDAIPIDAARPATLANTKSTLGSLNEGLKSNQELSGMLADTRLKGFQDALEGTVQQVPTGLLDSSGNPIMRAVQKGGGLSWQDMKAFRSYVGEKLNGLAFQNDTSQSALKALYGALSGDMEQTARAAGPKALASFQRANRYWRARQDRIEHVIKPILGEKGNGGPQAAFNQIASWSSNRGETIRVAQLIRSLPEDEAAVVRASIFSKLGNAKDGQQNFEGTEFSPSTFATMWHNLDSRAKAALFGNGAYRKDIDDIVLIAHRMRDASKYANNSKTSLGVNAVNLTLTALSGPTGIAVAGGEGALQFGTGKLLASPRFARWLVSANNKPNPAAKLAHIKRLTAVARAEPAIANEVLQLQQRLASAFTGSSVPTSLAAQEPTNEPDGGQGNASQQGRQQDGLQP